MKKMLKLSTLLMVFACFTTTTSCDKDDDDDNNKSQTTTHSYVDLGLESGTLWATFNVGASDSSNVYGDYFAWGEISPKETYIDTNYKWFNGTYSSENVTKYNITDNGDGLSTLESADDAATALWGNKWRMPTHDEYQELIDGCNWEWTNNCYGYGVAGYKGTSKANGNIIYFPAGGENLLEKNEQIGTAGYYWSSSLGESTVKAWYFVFNNRGYISCFQHSSREAGRNVRAVMK